MAAKPDGDGDVVTSTLWQQTFNPGASVRETSRKQGEEQRGLEVPVVVAGS